MKTAQINQCKTKSHPEGFLLRIFHLLSRYSLKTTNNQTKGGPELRPLRTTTLCHVKAFTLIELLVVVLIIGILAAIAVPQYQKAVAKARFAELKIVTKQLYNAQQMYYLENGRYSNKRDELAISLGPVPTNTPNYNLPFAHGSCGVEGSVNNEHPGAQNIYCQLNKPEISLWFYLTIDRKMCCNHELNNSTLDQFCKEEVKTKSVYGETTIKRCYVS